MERKKIFRSVWFWIAVVVVLAFIGSSFFRSDGGYDQVSTSTALAQISDGNVDSVTINDKEQTLDLDLKTAVDGSSSSPWSAARTAAQVPHRSTPTSPRTTCWSACWSASCPSSCCSSCCSGCSTPCRAAAVA
jgi:hypothetical protein